MSIWVRTEIISCTQAFSYRPLKFTAPQNTTRKSYLSKQVFTYQNELIFIDSSSCVVSHVSHVCTLKEALPRTATRFGHHTMALFTKRDPFKKVNHIPIQTSFVFWQTLLWEICVLIVFGARHWVNHRKICQWLSTQDKSSKWGTVSRVHSFIVWLYRTPRKSQRKSHSLVWLQLI